MDNKIYMIYVFVWLMLSLWRRFAGTIYESIIHTPQHKPVLGRFFPASSVGNNTEDAVYVSQVSTYTHTHTSIIDKENLVKYFLLCVVATDKLYG